MEPVSASVDAISAGHVRRDQRVHARIALTTASAPAASQRPIAACCSAAMSSGFVVHGAGGSEFSGTT